MTMGMSIAPTNKRTIRQPANPLDKATIVSIYPRVAEDTKHTIQPGIFKISAGTVENPSTLVVGPSSWWRDIGEEMPLIEIPVGAVIVAQSFVVDYCNGMLMCDMETAMPGLFYIPGELTIENIREKYTNEMANAVKKQNKWFDNLIELADVGWARTNGSPNAINDLMRMAADARGKSDKDWMKSAQDTQKIKCVACGNLRNPLFPVCAACNRIVDIVLATKLGIIDSPKVATK